MFLQFVLHILGEHRQARQLLADGIMQFLAQMALLQRHGLSQLALLASPLDDASELLPEGA